MKHKSLFAIFLLFLACSPQNSGDRPEGADRKAGAGSGKMKPPWPKYIPEKLFYTIFGPLWMNCF